MTCVLCKNGVTRPGMVTVTLERGKTVVVVRDVPADVCENLRRVLPRQHGRAGSVPAGRGSGCPQRRGGNRAVCGVAIAPQRSSAKALLYPCSWYDCVDAEIGLSPVPLGAARLRLCGFLFAVLWRRAGFKRAQKPGRDRGHLIDGSLERGLVGLRRFVATADFSDELQRRRVNLFRSHRRIEVEKILDIPAHGNDYKVSERPTDLKDSESETSLQLMPSGKTTTTPATSPESVRPLHWQAFRRR